MPDFEELMAAQVVANKDINEEYRNDDSTDYQEDNFGDNF